MPRVVALGIIVLAGLVVAGIAFLPEGKSDRPTSAASTAKVEAYWRAELTRGVQERPRLRFANLPRDEFFKRLDRAAALYNFEVVSVDFLRPQQVAPLVVVRSVKPSEFTHHVPAVLRSIDPHVATGDDRTGWAWEGFYFEVRDGAGNPAIATFNFWRSASGGGGQWARDESLYPFEHG